jgi:probable phosphoglycerate mutase
MDDLGEIYLGEWQGLEIAELDRREEWNRFNAFRSGVRVPGGELMVETQTRVVRRLLCLCGEHRDETVAVVSHGDPLRSVLMYFLGIPLDFMLRFEISPGSVSVLEVGDGGPRVLCLNRTGEMAV